MTGASDDAEVLKYATAQVWTITEKDGHFKYPLCEFMGLPWGLLVHYEERHTHPGKSLLVMIHSHADQLSDGGSR